MKFIMTWKMVQAVAHAIADVQCCGSCAGTKIDKLHCKACEHEAKVAIKAVQNYLKSRVK